MKNYMPRIVDKTLQNKLEYMGAVLIEGCKWCGKSTTARQFAKSYIESKTENSHLYPLLKRTGDAVIKLDLVQDAKPALENLQEKM